MADFICSLVYLRDPRPLRVVMGPPQNTLAQPGGRQHGSSATMIVMIPALEGDALSLEFCVM